jgi:hypothetical protein
MVISHKYKYVFIETPQTGCSAIRNELVEKYKGEIILSKHSVYSEFLASATKEEREYFAFSSIRNPLDKSTSSYMKFKNNHRNRYTDRLKFKGRQAIFDIRDRATYKKIKNRDISYSEYLQSSIIPYDDISTLDHKKFSFLIRFENLTNDFENALIEIGITPVRNLPMYNNTKNKQNYLDYYKDEKTKLVAINKFIYFMKYWNYKFPDDWNNPKINTKHKVIWNFFHILRIFSWRYLRKGLKDV